MVLINSIMRVFYLDLKMKACNTTISDRVKDRVISARPFSSTEPGIFICNSTKKKAPYPHTDSHLFPSKEKRKLI